MTTKILASFTAIVGGLTVVYSFLGAWGIELSQNQQDATSGILGLALVVAGLWLHPGVPIGVQEAGPADDGNLTDQPVEK